MAIDYDNTPEVVEDETGPVLERPEHADDVEIEDDDGFEDIEDIEAYLAALAEPSDEEVGD